MPMLYLAKFNTEVLHDRMGITSCLPELQWLPPGEKHRLVGPIDSSLACTVVCTRLLEITKVQIN